MIVVGDCIVSDDIADRCFGCDLARCKGQCCVEGDFGAPLEEAEVAEIRRLYPAIKPYMVAAGIAAIERFGVSVPDYTDSPCTPLVDGRECAFVTWDENGTALCAIEKAFRDGKIPFKKPVSCHLYPIRIDDYGSFQTVNYHQWDVCHQPSANNCQSGCPSAIPLYRYLKEPLVRKFGEAWYDELVDRIENPDGDGQ